MRRRCWAGGLRAGWSRPRSQDATYELLLSGIFHLILSDSICPHAPEAVDSETVPGQVAVFVADLADLLSCQMSLVLWILLNFFPSFSASSAKMGLVETKLAIIPGGGTHCLCPSAFVSNGAEGKQVFTERLPFGQRPTLHCLPAAKCSLRCPPSSRG